jgi:prepilin-type processing-associated H-X9-DG protein
VPPQIPPGGPPAGYAPTDPAGPYAPGPVARPGGLGRGLLIAGVILLCVVVGFGMLIAILLPSLNKARETANRAKCASNMHRIGLAIIMYQRANNQEYPPSLTVLATQSAVSPDIFVCPSSNDTPAASLAQVETPGHCSYIYYGRGDVNPSATDVVLSENDSDHVDGMNLLFGDGHAEWMQIGQAKMLVDQAKKDLAYRDAHPGAGAAMQSPFGMPR